MSFLIIAYHLLLRAIDSLDGSVARWESTADTQPQLHPALGNQWKSEKAETMKVE
jgi:hypothetical protein